MRLKKSLVIFLLLIFLFNAFGFWIAFKIEQNQIYAQVKKEIKKALKNTVPSDELYGFNVLNGKDLPENATWVKPEKEFRLNGNMYDIVRRENNNGRSVLYCINDKQEKALFANLDEHIEKHIATHSKNKNSKTKTEKKAIDLYDLPTKSGVIITYKLIKYPAVSENYFPHFLDSFYPPPQLI